MAEPPGNRPSEGPSDALDAILPPSRRSASDAAPSVVEDDGPCGAPEPAGPAAPAAVALPAHVPGSGGHDRAIERARAYARNAKAPNTRRAYARDWRHFEAWCHRRGHPALPPAPEVVGLYVADCADGRAGGAALSVATIERRLAGIAWTCAQRGAPLDRRDRHIRSVLDGVRRAHARPPRRKEAVSGADLIAMLDTLGHDLRAIRDRAILLLGFAGSLRRSEIVALDTGRDESDDLPGGAGWFETIPGGMILHVPGKTGWRQVEVGEGSRARTCPVRAALRWVRFARIEGGPLFRPISRDGRRALDRRLGDRSVALLVKRAAMAAGLRGDVAEGARLALFAGHSLRAGVPSHAAAEERVVQRQLGHASAEMTRRYQRDRDRLAVNLTKAAGL